MRSYDILLAGLPTKTFSHKHVQYEKPWRVDIDGRRHYTNGSYVVPSVTTILGTVNSGKFDWWYDAIGHEKAQLITKQSGARGSRIHKLAENYIMNRPILTTDEEVDHFDIESVSMYKGIHRILTEHVDNIVLSEGMVISPKLGVGGTIDLLAEWDGELQVIDFKNARYHKTRAEITEYFIQETLYSLMVLDCMDVAPKKIVTIIAVENDRKPLVFVEEPGTYLPEVRETMRRYKEIVDASPQQHA